MSSSRRPWFPWYPKEFVSDEKVRGLSDDAELLYRRILDCMWEASAVQLPNNCTIVANQVARGWSDERFQKAWVQLWTDGFEIFKTTECGKFFYSDRLSKEAQKIENISKTRSKIGKKAHQAKAKQLPSKSQAIEEQLPSHPDPYPDINNNPPTPQGGNGKIPYREIIERLNAKSGKNFSPTTKETQRSIKARWNSGFRLKDFNRVIDTKCEKWKTDPKMVDYLRPQTLFGTNFEAYLNEPPAKNNTCKPQEYFNPDAPDRFQDDCP
jgi:uncharacterized phage protein (TIGR02220 family)